MSLDQYRSKRKLAETPEPAGSVRDAGESRIFVVQKHAARRLHYDFRLAISGVLASWAVPRGPSMNPADKRLAIRTEDHPLEYADFEGVIPAGQYGAADEGKRWLLVKHRDEHADPSWNIESPELDRSVLTGRTLQEIAAGAPAKRSGSEARTKRPNPSAAAGRAAERPGRRRSAA
jgi:bifunctional non-homologous end joining protein LigD